MTTNGKLDPVKIERNGVTLTLDPMKYKRGEKKELGEEFLGLKVNEDNYQDVGTWLGKDVLISKYRGFTNQRLQALMNEACTAIDDKGKEISKPFDLAEFIELATAFSARGETMEDIKNEIEDLTEELSNLWENLTPEKAGERAREIGDKIRQLRNAREAKRRDRGTKEETVAA